MEAYAPQLGPRERVVLLVMTACIVVWGLTGPMEYPTTPEEYSPPPSPQGVSGAALFEANGCNACHSTGREKKIGPGLGGIFGETVQLEDGSAAVIDEAYLHESILKPQAKIVAGFADAAMPSYEGLLSENDVRAIATYIKGLD